MLALLDETFVRRLHTILAVILILRRCEVADAEHGEHVVFSCLDRLCFLFLLFLLRFKLGCLSLLSIDNLVPFGRFLLHLAAVSTRASLSLLEGDDLLTGQCRGNCLFAITAIARPRISPSSRLLLLRRWLPLVRVRRGASTSVALPITTLMMML